MNGVYGKTPTSHHQLVLFVSLFINNQLHVRWGIIVRNFAEWWLLSPEEISFCTGTVQCRHKTAVLKRKRWQVVLHSRYLVFKAVQLTGSSRSYFSSSNEPDEGRLVSSSWSLLLLWSDLRGSWRTPPFLSGGECFGSLRLDVPSPSSWTGSPACGTSFSPGPAPPQGGLPGTGTQIRTPPISKEEKQRLF